MSRPFTRKGPFVATTIGSRDQDAARVTTSRLRPSNRPPTTATPSCSRSPLIRLSEYDGARYRGDELVLAVELGATADDIANTMRIHPTQPERINSAAGGGHTPRDSLLLWLNSSPCLAGHVVQVPGLPEFEERSIEEFPDDELFVMLGRTVLAGLHLLSDRR